MNTAKYKSALGKILLILSVVFILAIGGGVYWLTTPSKPTARAMALQNSTPDYDVSTGSDIVFIPKEKSTKGVIFYPGGKVEAGAYSYICASLAASGYTCIIAVMPLNLAVFRSNAANEIISRYQDIDEWVIAGHSLGGSMAARYVKDNAEKIKGLALLGAYSDIDLKGKQLQVSLLTGSQDGVLNKDTYIKSLANLPEGYREIVIAGGNHAQFGDYGEQSGDNQPIISIEAQHEQVISELKLMLGE